jgi:hypothetical protein
MRRWFPLLVPLALAGITHPICAAEPATPSAPEVRFANEKLTVRADAAPLADVLAAVGRATGAEVRGEPAPAPPVTLKLDDVPVKEALTRILGDQSFTLTYTEHGGLRLIDLRGGPQAPIARKPLEEASSSGLPDSLDRSAADIVAAWVASDTRHPITGRLADKLGTKDATVSQIVDAALSDDDPRVRSQALRAALNLLEGDREVRDAFVKLLDSVDDEFLVRYVQLSMKDNAKEIVSGIARQASTQTLRVRTQHVLEALRTTPPPS